MRPLLALLSAYLLIGIWRSVEIGLRGRESLYRTEETDLYFEIGYWGAILVREVPCWPFFL